MKYGNNLDLAKNQILNVALQTLTQAPIEPVLGQIYYNSQDSRVYCWTGAIWLPLDAKDASPTSVSIVNTINGGTSQINMSKINGLDTKLSADNLVQTINEGNSNINAARVQGLTDAISGSSIVSKINDGTNTIRVNKVEGLEEAIKTSTIVANINAGTDTIAISKVTNLATELSSKETPTGAQDKANTALQQAKDFTTSEIARVVGGASEAFDTLKEIETELKSNKNVSDVLTQGLAKRTQKFTKSIGDNTATDYTVEHNLNTQDVVVMVRESKAPFAQIFTDIEVTDENHVAVKFAKAPSIDEYKVIVIG